MERNLETFTTKKVERSFCSLTTMNNKWCGVGMSLFQMFDKIRLFFSIGTTLLHKWSLKLTSFFDISYNVVSAFSLEQLHLNKNDLSCIFYPGNNMMNQLSRDYELDEKSFKPFQKLRCLLLGSLFKLFINTWCIFYLSIIANDCNVLLSYYIL